MRLYMYYSGALFNGHSVRQAVNLLTAVNTQGFKQFSNIQYINTLAERSLIVTYSGQTSGLNS